MSGCEITLKAMQDAAVLVDERGVIMQANPAFEALSGWAEQELVGQPLRRLEAACSGGTEGASLSGQSSSGPDENGRMRARLYRRRTGETFWGEMVAVPLGSEGGACVYVVHDVSVRIGRAQGLTALITFVADQPADAGVELSTFLDLGCRYFELELGVLCGSNAAANSIEALAGGLALELSAADLAEDRHFKAMLASDEVMTVIEGGRQAACSNEDPRGAGLLTLLACPVRSIGKRYGTLCFASRRLRRRPFDGQERQIMRFLAQWLASRRDAESASRSHARASERLRRSEERHRLFYEKTPAMLQSIDDHGRLANVSDVWLATMGFRRDEVIGRPSTDFLTPQSKRLAEEVVLPAYRAHGHCEDVPYQFVTKGGEIRDIELSAITQYNDDGGFIRSLAILRDVTERKQVEQKLQRKTAALKRSNADLQRFNHIASHDLQEPLRRIITYCEILKEDHGPELSEEAATITSTIQSGGRRLRLMINDLLAYIRVREQLERTFEPVDMSAVLGHALEDLNDAFAFSDLHMDVAHLPLVWGRAPLFKMVFHQLLSNAVIHGSRQVPAIRVSVDDAGDVWRFGVADQGVGVEPRFADRIFEIFQRLHHKDEGKGSGAGLAICQMIVQRCGGEIWLDSSYDDGARFFFTLPKDRPRAQEAAPAASLAPRSEIDLAVTRSALDGRNPLDRFRSSMWGRSGHERA